MSMVGLRLEKSKPRMPMRDTLFSGKRFDAGLPEIGRSKPLVNLITFV